MTQGRVRLLLRVNAAVGFVFGLGLLVLPKALLDLYGVSAADPVLAMARFYGAELAGFNVATWLAAEVPSARRPVIAGHIVNESLTAVVAAWAVLTDLGGVLLWSLVVVAGAFAAAYALAWPERVRG